MERHCLCKVGTGFLDIIYIISGCRGLSTLEEFYLLGYNAM
jgi:hypothetical protein